MQFFNTLFTKLPLTSPQKVNVNFIHSQFFFKFRIFFPFIKICHPCASQKEIIEMSKCKYDFDPFFPSALTQLTQRPHDNKRTLLRFYLRKIQITICHNIFFVHFCCVLFNRFLSYFQALDSIEIQTPHHTIRTLPIYSIFILRMKHVVKFFFLHACL